LNFSVALAIGRRDGTCLIPEDDLHEVEFAD